MSQWIKVLASKSENLRSAPELHGIKRTSYCETSILRHFRFMDWEATGFQPLQHADGRCWIAPTSAAAAIPTPLYASQSNKVPSIKYIQSSRFAPLKNGV